MPPSIVAYGALVAPLAETGIHTEDAVTVHTPFRRSVHTEVIIDAPPERVWRELTDFAEMPSWSRSLQGIRGELRPGGRVVVTFLTGAGRVRAVGHELVVFEEGRALGWTGPSGPGLRGHHVFRLTPLDGGRTLLTQDDEANGFMSLFLGVHTTNGMVGTYRAFNDALRGRVEGAVGLSDE